RYERWLWSIRDAAAIRREIFVECPIAHPCLAVRRRTLLALGYRERGFPEDWDLVLRLVRGGHGLSMVPRRLLGWRDGPSRLSRNHPMYALQAFVDCRAHHLAAGPLEGHDSYLLWGFGDTGKALKRALLAFGKRPAAIVELHPGRIGQTIEGAEVVAPEAVPSLPPLPMLVSVAGAQARGEIRGFLDGIGRRETIDYHCCA
ncbi:MAG: glycosyl transferase family 2, partial [Myxococcales bacterium]|nr:glycosyl transferase family 2 [Myxococcales bacterium]